MLLRQKRKLISLLVFLSLLLTGCNNGSLDIDLDLDNEITREISTWGDREVKSSTEDLSIKNVEAEKLDMKISMGSVTVRYSEDNSVAIDVKYEAYGSEEEKLSEILSVVAISYELEDDNLTLMVINKNTKENIWDWIHEEYDNPNNRGTYNLSANIDISLPATVNQFNIEDSMGNIHLEAVKGSFHIVNAMGSIELDDVIFTGESDIKVSMGNIDCKLLKDLQGSAVVSMESIMGNISIDTDDMEYESVQEKDDNFMGGIETIYINDVFQIDAKVDMGDVSVEK